MDGQQGDYSHAPLPPSESDPRVVPPSTPANSNVRPSSNPGLAQSPDLEQSSSCRPSIPVAVRNRAPAATSKGKTLEAKTQDLAGHHAPAQLLPCAPSHCQRCAHNWRCYWYQSTGRSSVSFSPQPLLALTITRD